MHALNSERAYKRVIAERRCSLTICDPRVASERARKVDAVVRVVRGNQRRVATRYAFGRIKNLLRRWRVYVNGAYQMVAARAEIAKLKGRRIAELSLNGQVPLLRDRRDERIARSLQRARRKRARRCARNRVPQRYRRSDRAGQGCSVAERRIDKGVLFDDAHQHLIVVDSVAAA